MGSMERSFRRQHELKNRWHKGKGRLIPPLAAAVKKACTAYFGELGEIKKEVENRDYFDAEVKTEMKLNGAK